MENLYSKKIIFTNKVIDKRQLKALISDIFNKYGTSKCTYLADRLKVLGFRFATQAGISLNIEDLRVPNTKKESLKLSEIHIQKVEESFARADITSVDRFQFVLDKWSSVSDRIKEEVVKFFIKTDPFNPIYLMAFSGARGNLSQVRQLIGMRGLMADPQGQLIGLPIKSNFREGLTITEYIISSYGARKGIVDTALKTADSGYLTRRLVDVSQDIIIRSFDCGTLKGIEAKVSSNITLQGRTVLKDVFNSNGNLIISKNKQIDENIINQIKLNNISEVAIRSSITCQLNHSICQLCYGWNLATRKLIDLGEAVGILAAQSIGEPGTQLTMRTFHTGGTFMGTLSDAVYPFAEGKVRVIGEKSNFQPKKFSQGEWNINLNKTAIIELEKLDGRLSSLTISKNSALTFKQNGSLVNANDVISKPPIIESRVSELAKKRISSDKQGLVSLENLSLLEKEDKNGNVTQIAQTQGFVWVSLSSVITVPTNTLLQVEKGDILKKNKCIIKSFVSNTFGGFYQGENNKNLYDILLGSYFLENGNLIKNSNLFTLSSSHLFNEYKLNLTKKSFNDSIQIVGESIIDLGFKSKSGRLKTDNLINDFYTSATTKSFPDRIHIIPEYYFTSIQAETEICVKAGDFVEEGWELFTGTFAEQSGVVDILENVDGTFDLVLRPGYVLDWSFNSILIKNNKEVIALPNDISKYLSIKEGQLVFVEQLIFEEDKKSFLISPVESFTFPPQKQLSFKNNEGNFEVRKPFIFFENFTFLFNDGDIIKNIKDTKIAVSQLIFEFKLPKSSFKAKINIDSTDKNSYVFRIDIFERLNNQLELRKNNNVKNQKLLHDKQYIYPLSKSFENLLLSKENSLVYKTEKFSANRKLLSLQKKSDCQVFKTNEKINKIFKKGDFLRRGLRVENKFYAQAAGKLQVLDLKLYGKNSSHFIVQRAKPYLIAKNSILKTRQGNLVKKNDLIGFLTYEVVKTEDIIQGLPRVEEILEARPPKVKAFISDIPGFVSVIDEKLEKSEKADFCTVIIQNQSGLREKKVIPKLRKIVKTGDFVELGDRLTDGQRDLRELLQINFNFYNKVLHLGNYLSSIKSFRHLQLLLINEIQNVYKSQGVDISDKHIEIIVRQMTTKVRIEDSGKTTLVPGELVDLEKIRRINAIAQYQGFDTATYTPTLLGITKASLSTDSFISAASFQETARVLTKAAVEGKKDWLKGLKENVIVGNLIPAGTGFKENSKNLLINEEDYNEKCNLEELILDKRTINLE